MMRGLQAIAAICSIMLACGAIGAHGARAQSPAPAAATQTHVATEPAQSPRPPAAPQAATPEHKLFPSIMFWPDEVAAIEKAIEEHEHPPVAVQQAKADARAAQAAAEEGRRPRMPNVYVSAILDFGDGNWAVWANGLRVTPTSQSPLFHVNAVRGNAVDIVVPGANGAHFQLQPNQTWRSRQRDIVEGIYP
jgi:hypothetical protein